MKTNQRTPTEVSPRQRRPLAGLLSAVLTALLLVLAAQNAVANDPFLRRTPTVRAVEKVGPSVVSITTQQLEEVQNPFSRLSPSPKPERYYSNLFDERAPSSTHDLGSGVIISSQGHILTNEHVIRRARRVSITLADGRSFAARVIGADPTNDIAVLEVETDESLPWAAPGSSADIMVGEPVIAIGNPFGFANTVTTGVISATNRSFRAGQLTFHGFLQTDASINPGNSGGPLLNAEGSLIGINTAIYQGAEGIGFAIPIDAARRVVNELIEHGEVHPVTLGIDFQDLDPALREVMGLPTTMNGSLINRVRPGGPAEIAGIRRGDILTQINGQNIQSARQLYEVLETTTPEQRLQVYFLRDGKTMDVTLVAREIPENVAAELASRLMGLGLAWRDQIGFEISTVRPQSPAAAIGLLPGDYLLAVNGLILDGDEALRRAILGLRGRNRALVVVQRGRGRYHLMIPLK
ncbi:MAG: trypsin-like peptidase domain-containing protein [Myxococcota bacterium]|nr:trypsin-like peptidase domain-containing protein [Myxococcota bacterium]